MSIPKPLFRFLRLVYASPYAIKHLVRQYPNMGKFQALNSFYYRLSTNLLGMVICSKALLCQAKNRGIRLQQTGLVRTVLKRADGNQVHISVFFVVVKYDANVAPAAIMPRASVGVENRRSSNRKRGQNSPSDYHFSTAIIYDTIFQFIRVWVIYSCGYLSR